MGVKILLWILASKVRQNVLRRQIGLFAIENNIPATKFGILSESISHCNQIVSITL